VSSMFAFGRAAGVIEGVLAGLGVPFDFLSPGMWKSALNVSASKDASRHKSVMLWPQWSIEFSRAKDDGRAEAALIGLFGARKYARETIGTGPSLEEQLAQL
jgi:crossover junction endodeoxyribonuclease RuvC